MAIREVERMSGRNDSFDCFVYDGTMEEVRDALVKRFNAEVEIEPGYEDEWDLTLHSKTGEIMEAYIYGGDSLKGPGVNIRTSGYSGDTIQWCNDIFECLSEALTNDLYISQLSVEPMFICERTDGVITEESVAA